jgi:hypothetical protein
MPHPSKKQRLTVMEANSAEATVADQTIVTAWKEAVKMTIVPPSDFRVNSVRRYNGMTVMATELPNLQQVRIAHHGYKYNDGEDPDEDYAALTANWPAHDIEIISNFSKLRILDIYVAPLNGRYPILFSSFPLLQKLTINECGYLKWDLEMLAGLPLLKELECYNGLTSNACVTGNISSLRVLKDTLEKVIMNCCPNVVGNFMDLADFPHLKELDLWGTAVTGDIRDINANDFSALEFLDIPKGVYGGRGYELQSISDGLDLIRTLYLFNKQRPNLIDSLLPTLSGNSTLYWKLVEDSPDWYEPAFEDDDDTPFFIKFVKAGSRLGYRWESDRRNPCEVNWLDPEPDRDSSDYGKYIEELQEINSEVHMFRGFYQPPTEEEYHRLWEEHNIDD